MAQATTKECNACGAKWITTEDRCRSCNGPLMTVPVPAEHRGADGTVCLTPWTSDPVEDFARTLNESHMRPGRN